MKTYDEQAPWRYGGLVGVVIMYGLALLKQNQPEVSEYATYGQFAVMAYMLVRVIDLIIDYWEKFHA